MHKVGSVAFSSDGKRAVTVGESGRVRLWSVPSGKEIPTRVTEWPGARFARFVVNNDLLLTEHATGEESISTVRIWDLAKKRKLLQGLAVESLMCVDFPTGRVVGWAKSTPVLRDTFNVRTLRTFAPAHVNCAAFSPDGRKLLTGGGKEDHTVRLWTLDEVGEIQALHGHSDAILGLAFSRSGDLGASAGRDGQLIVWDLKEGVAVRVIEGLDPPLNGEKCSVAFSAKGKTIVTSLSKGVMGCATVWDVTTGKLVRRLMGWGQATAAAISPDGRTVLVGADDGRLDWFDLATGKSLRAAVREHRGEVVSAAISPKGDVVASGADDHTVLVRNLATGHVRAAFRTRWPVKSVAFSPDGRRILVVSGDPSFLSNGGTAEAWEWATGRKVRSFWHGGSGDIDWVEFSRSGNLLIAGNRHNVWTLWDAVSRKKIHFPKTEKADCIAVSPDETRAAMSTPDGRLVLWSVADRKQVAVLARVAKGPVQGLAFSPDGKWIAAKEGARALAVWEAQGGKLKHSLKWEEGILSFRFLAGGHLLAAETGVHGLFRPKWSTFTLLDVRSGARVGRWTRKEGGYGAVVFSADGKLAVENAGHELILRKASSGKPLDTIRLTDRDDYRARYGPTSVAISPNRKHLIVGTFGWVTLRFDVSDRWGSKGTPMRPETSRQREPARD